MPKISVCMPFYNTDSFINEAIESILEQTFEDFELIMVNDGSTDNSEAIVHGFKDKRIRYAKNHHDYIQSLNIGLELATGKYIARMDADDKSHKDRLLIQYNYLESYPDIAACGTGLERFGLYTGKVIPQNLNSDEIEMAFLEANHFSIGMIRRDFLNQHNIRYNPSFIYAEDYKLYADIIMAGGKLENLPQILYYYRHHKQQISTHNSEQTRLNSLKIQQELMQYLIHRDRAIYKDIAKTNDTLIELYLRSDISIEEYCAIMRILIKSQH